MAVAHNWKPRVLDDNRERSIDVEDALASQFEQVWLQHQIPSPEYPFPVQPFFSSGIGWQLEPGVRVSEAEETDPLNDPVLTYISDMMEEDIEDRPGMVMDSSSYQAMTQELTELLTETSSVKEEPSPCCSHPNGGFHQETAQYPSNWFRNFGGEPYPCADSQKYGVSSSAAIGKIPQKYGVSSSAAIGKSLGGSAATSAQAANNVDNFLDSDQEMIRFIQEEVAAHNSGEFNRNDEITSEECPKRLASLYPCPENRILLPSCVNGEVSADQPSIMVGESGWQSCPKLLGTSEGLNLPQINMEKSAEELEIEKENKLKLNYMLIECAKATASDDITQAYRVANEIREIVSAYGDSSQRLAHHFVEALAARMTDTGALLYSALLTSRPSAAEMLKAYYLFVSKHPNIRISHYFADQAILDACEGAKRLHVVDFGILHGFPWPCLIKALSFRPGGPPHLRITGIDFPQPGLKPAERVEETGRRLAEYARTWGVAFEYKAVADNWENVQLSSLDLRHDEVLVVTSIFRLRHLFDETVKIESPRKVVLNRIRSMNPKVFVQGVLNGCYNSAFFLTRFSEALSFYGSIFDAIDGSIPHEHPERLLVEQQILGPEILNIVACEGVERVERAESYKHWESRTLRAGFEQMPLNPNVYGKARAMLSSFHKDHGIGQDGNWLLLGWKNRVMNALTTWRPHR